MFGLGNLPGDADPFELKLRLLTRSIEARMPRVGADPPVAVAVEQVVAGIGFVAADRKRSRCRDEAAAHFVTCLAGRPMAMIEEA